MTLFSNEIFTFSQKLTHHNHIVIVPHKDPDGDAIGSALAWCNVLSAKGFSVDVISPNEVPVSLKWMNQSDRIIDFTKSAEVAKAIIDKAEILLFLDFNSLPRTGKMVEVLTNCKAFRVMIDHHPFPDENVANVLISDTTVSSTCELTYKVMVEMGLVPDKQASECLYAGIMTDTGMLNHNSSNPELYHIIAHLLEAGIDKEMVHREVFHSNSLSRMRLLGHALCNELDVLTSGKVALIALSAEELAKFSYKPGDTEGFVNYPLSIDGIEVSALITEKEKGLVKISLRSRGDVSVNTYSETYFSGGGHRNAAGGEFKGDIAKAVDKFKQSVESYFGWD